MNSPSKDIDVEIPDRRQPMTSGQRNFRTSDHDDASRAGRSPHKTQQTADFLTIRDDDRKLHLGGHNQVRVWSGRGQPKSPSSAKLSFHPPRPLAKVMIYR